MSLEAISIAAAFLADETYGVNALLPRMPHDLWDDLPPEITVADETRDAFVAQRLIPKDVNHCLMVLLANDAIFDGTPTMHTNADGEPVRSLKGTTVDILALYAVRKSAKEVGLRFVKDILRAARNSFVLLNDPENATRRTANGVILLPFTGFRQVPFNAEKGDALLTAGLVASCEVRETVASLSPDP